MSHVEQLIRDIQTPHTQLDHHPLLIGLGDGTAPPKQYAEVLSRFHGFWLAAEQQVYARADVLGLLTDAADRAIMSGLIAKDLAALGYPIPQGSLPVVNFDWVDDLFSAMGVVFTLEGSTLGGGKISAALAKQQNLGTDNGAAFYNSYGEKRGSMWKTFMDTLNGMPISSEEDKKLLSSALKTFTALDVRLSAPFTLQRIEVVLK